MLHSHDIPPSAFSKDQTVVGSPPTWSSERQFSHCLRHATQVPMKWKGNLSWRAAVLPPQSGTLQPRFPIKILLYHCCTNVSSYRRAQSCCDKAVTSKSGASRRMDSMSQCKVPNIFCSLPPPPNLKKFVENLESCGPFTCKRPRGRDSGLELYLWLGRESLCGCTGWKKCLNLPGGAASPSICWIWRDCW